ncbi:HotDog domain-containing protein [Pelagophyceae sp. CCMP2097]|nr:HotDog domain-containing protein [Pelagophyceae sp. CCMP2097]
MLRAVVALCLFATGAAFQPPRAHAARTQRAAEEAGAEAPAYRTAEEVSALTAGVTTHYTLEEIHAILPHRYPFALVDKVISYEAGKRAVGIKCISFNEPQFMGHFPGRPIMPGVMQIEALAQLAGVVCLQMEGAAPGSVFFFAGCDGVKWKRPVVPGDVLVMEVEIKAWKAKFGIAKASGKAYVDGKLAVVVEEMTFALAK